MKGIELETKNEVLQPEVVKKNDASQNCSVSKSKNNELVNSPQTIQQAAAQNFTKILELAGGVVEIRKMKTASDALLAKMDADCKQLLVETEAYVEKKNADTKSIVERMTVIRLMMQDFYQQSNQQITGEDFRQIITSIVDQMGRMNHE